MGCSWDVFSSCFFSNFSRFRDVNQERGKHRAPWTAVGTRRDRLTAPPLQWCVGNRGSTCSCDLNRKVVNSPQNLMHLAMLKISENRIWESSTSLFAVPAIFHCKLVPFSARTNSVSFSQFPWFQTSSVIMLHPQKSQSPGVYPC